MSKAIGLKPDDVPPGTKGDAIWRIGENLFTISIVPKDKAPEIGNLTDLIIGGDVQNCGGDFSSGATLDAIDTVGVTRAYTNCQTQQATTC